MKRFLIATVAIWVVLFIATFFTATEELGLGERFLGTLGMSALAGVGVVSGNLGEGATRKRESGMISCKNCGYLGAGSGFCPRCGRNNVEKLTADTQMVSCPKCGYLGAGSGACPKCGSTRAQKIKR